MRKSLCMLAAVLAVSAAPAATAAVVDFNAPGLIVIDNDTNRASYNEAGFSLMGEAASFLTIDDLGSGGSGGLVLFGGNSVSIVSADRLPFNFLGLDAGLFDPNTPAMLSLTGIVGGGGQFSTTVTLGSLASLPLTDWTGLSELRLSASADLVIDNLQVSPVPEPGMAAMLLLGMGGLLLRSAQVRKVIGKR